METLPIVLNAATLVVLVVATALLAKVLGALRTGSRAASSAASSGDVAQVTEAVGNMDRNLTETLAALKDQLRAVGTELSSTREALTSGTALMSTVSQEWAGQAEAAVALVERAGERVSEFEASSQRHGEALRAAAMASLEELLKSCDDIAVELRGLRDRQASALTSQEQSAVVLEKLATSIDGYVEILGRVAA